VVFSTDTPPVPPIPPPPYPGGDPNNPPVAGKGAMRKRLTPRRTLSSRCVLILTMLRKVLTGTGKTQLGSGGEFSPMAVLYPKMLFFLFIDDRSEHHG